MKHNHAPWSDIIPSLLVFSLTLAAAISFAQESPLEEAEPSATAAIDSATPAKTAIPWVSSSKPPLAFDETRILHARDQARRVGWTDAVIDAQAGEAASKEERIWRLCQKAAIFGDKSRAEKAANALLESVSGQEIAGSRDDLWKTFGLLAKSYDCLMAIPEWKDLDASLRDPLRDAFQAQVKTCFEKNQTPIAGQDALSDLSLRIYAGLLAGATAFAHSAYAGEEGKPGFVSLLNQEFTPEGLLRNGSLRRQVESGDGVLITGCALRACSPEIFAPVESSLRCSVESIVDLVYPAGRFPSAVREIPDPIELSRYLERGNLLLNLPRIAAVLDRLYQEKPRSAESLLMGGLTIARKKPAIVPSRALPQTGVVILNDASSAIPLSIFFDVGLSGASPSSALLAMEWKQETPPQIGGAQSAATDRFNTVTIDRKSQPPAPTEGEDARNPLLYSCKLFDDGATYVHAIASGQFTERAAYPNDVVSTPVSTYERALFLASPLAVDLFWARGGKQHDWIYHSPAGIEKLINGDWAPYAVASGEYPWMSGAGVSTFAANLKGVYGVLFDKTPASEIRQRLWVIDPAGSQLISVKNEKSSSLILRREMIEDEGDLFAVVHEWFPESQAMDVQIERIPLDSAVNQRDFQASAFALVRGAETHIFLSSINPDGSYTAQYKNGQVVFQGAFGYIQLINGQAARLRLVGTTLRYDATGIQMPAALNLGVVKTVNSDTGEMKAQFENRLPVNEALSGDTLIALTPQLAPVMYRPLVIEKMSAWESEETVQLRYRPNPGNPQPGFGAPIATGDQLIYENCAELTLQKPDYYSLRYSAPADVTIGGATDRNRVFFMKSQLIQKVRGESTAGAIQFHVDTNESVDGRVEFYRIP